MPLGWLVNMWSGNSFEGGIGKLYVIKKDVPVTKGHTLCFLFCGMWFLNRFIQRYTTLWFRLKKRKKRKKQKSGGWDKENYEQITPPLFIVGGYLHQKYSLTNQTVQVTSTTFLSMAIRLGDKMIKIVFLNWNTRRGQYKVERTRHETRQSSDLNSSAPNHSCG